VSLASSGSCKTCGQSAGRDLPPTPAAAVLPQEQEEVVGKESSSPPPLRLQLLRLRDEEEEESSSPPPLRQEEELSARGAARAAGPAACRTCCGWLPIPARASLARYMPVICPLHFCIRVKFLVCMWLPIQEDMRLPVRWGLRVWKILRHDKDKVEAGGLRDWWTCVRDFFSSLVGVRG